VDQLIAVSTTLSGLALGATLTVLFAIKLFIKEYGLLIEKCDAVIKEAHQNLKQANEVNQALAAKIESLEDGLKTLDFWRTQGKK